jgi:hypothetical protein
VGALYIGVILPVAFPNAEEPHLEGIEGVGLKARQFGQALPSELLTPICLSLQDPGRKRRVDG